MSAEIIAVVVSAVGVVVTLGIGMFSGFAWVIRRTEKYTDNVEQRLGTRIDGVEQRLGAVEQRLGAVEVAVARIEGPRPHPITGR